MLGDSRLAVDLRFPKARHRSPSRKGQIGDGAFVERWTIQRAGGLAGQTMAIDGIAGGVTDVIVRIERLDGTSQVEHLLPQRPEFVIQGTTGLARLPVLPGARHRAHPGRHRPSAVRARAAADRARRRRIILTITAFTVAHSITLVAATLGWVHVPGPPVEAIDRAQHRLRRSRGRARPARPAGAYGACALGRGIQFRAAAWIRFRRRARRSRAAAEGDSRGAPDVQCRRGNRAVNIRRFPSECRVHFWPTAGAFRGWTHGVPPYAIGTVAMFWVIERIGAFWV